MKTAKISQRDALLKITRCEPFDAGSLHATQVPDGLRVFIGDLPTKYAREISVVDGPMYVVYSYRTPIAWRTDERIVIPRVQYSGTTTRHQNLVREAWNR